MAANIVQKNSSTERGVPALTQGLERSWGGRNVKILIGAITTAAGVVLMASAAAASLSLWPLALSVTAVGVAILAYEAYAYKEDPSKRSVMHIQLPSPEMLTMKKGVLSKETETVQKCPVSTAAAQEENPFSLSSSDRWLAASNAVQWGIIAASLFGIDPSMTAPIATAANIAVGFAMYGMLPKNGSWLRQALSIPFIYQKVIGFHPVVKGLAQLHSLYTLAQRSRSMLSAAWSQRTSHPVDALKVGGVQLFNVSSGLVFAADQAGLIELSAKATEAVKPVEQEVVVTPALEPAPPVASARQSPEPVAPVSAPSPEPVAPTPAPAAPLQPANPPASSQQSWLSWGWDWTSWVLFGPEPQPEPDVCQRKELSSTEWWAYFWFSRAFAPSAPGLAAPPEQSWFDWLRGAPLPGSQPSWAAWLYGATIASPVQSAQSTVKSWVEYSPLGWLFGGAPKPAPVPVPPPEQSLSDLFFGAIRWLRGGSLTPVMPQEPSLGQRFVDQVGLGWWFGSYPSSVPSAAPSTVKSWVEHSPLGWLFGAAQKPAPVPAALSPTPAPRPQRDAQVNILKQPTCPADVPCPKAPPCPKGVLVAEETLTQDLEFYPT